MKIMSDFAILFRFSTVARILENRSVLPIRNIKRVTIFQFVEFTAAINCIPNDEIKRDCKFGIQKKNVLLLFLLLPFTFFLRRSSASGTPHGVDAWQNSKLSTLIKLPKGLLQLLRFFYIYKKGTFISISDAYQKNKNKASKSNY